MKGAIMVLLVGVIGIPGCSKKTEEGGGSACVRVQKAVDRCVSEDPRDPTYLGSQWDNRAALTMPGEAPPPSMKDRCPSIQEEATAILGQCPNGPCGTMAKCIWEADLIDLIHRLPAYPTGSGCGRMHRRVLECLPTLPDHPTRGKLGSAWGCEVCAKKGCANETAQVTGLLEACLSKDCPALADCIRQAWAELSTSGWFCTNPGTPLEERFECPADPRCKSPRATPCSPPAAPAPQPTEPAVPVVEAVAPDAGAPEADAPPENIPEPPVGISRVRVEVKRHRAGQDRGLVYLSVDFTATVRELVSDNDRVVVRAACRTGADTMVDDSTSHEPLDDLEVSQSKSADVPLFLRAPFETAPDGCEISFILRPLFRGAATPLGTFCWNGRAVADGPCPME